MVLLQIEGLSREPWFRNRSLALESGQLITLSGPSGSGKSLFLRAIADLDPVDSGELWLDGKERSQWAPSLWRRRVLYMHQGGVMLPGTVEDNLRAVAGLGKHECADLRIPEGLRAEQSADRLSGGEAQKLALERALLVKPQVLLLDEPTAALDQDSKRAAEARILQWIASGGAALWISHEPEFPKRAKAALELSFP